MRDTWLESEHRSKLRADFEAAGPYPHAVMRPFLGTDAMLAVRADLDKIGAREKETDLFRFFQTADLAAAMAAGEAATTPQDVKGPRKRRRAGKPAIRVPALASLAKVFGSPEFRDLMQEVTQCGPLADRLDLSAQIYPRGGHLLCHDDVIGTRKVSFIYYLTDPTSDWTATEGGALELYPSETGAPRGTPAIVPSEELLPLSDSLAIFIVEPGVSFHAVREVRGHRARVSIQGWLHAPSLEFTASFSNRGLATLQQLLDKKSPAEPACPEAVVKEASVRRGSAEMTTHVAQENLTEQDLVSLARWISSEYLDMKSLSSISEHFEENSYAVLENFLRKDLAKEMMVSLQAADADAGLSGDVWREGPPYHGGVGQGWVAVGPPHLRRYLRFQGAPSDGPTICDKASVSPQVRLGTVLKAVADELFTERAFRRWLRTITQLDVLDEGDVNVRRFRPGLDYTVAANHETVLPGRASLDVTLGVVRDEDGADAEQWASEAWGGFECYMEADDEKAETVQGQERYKIDEGGPLVNLPAASNALCLVMRDAGTLRFMKYVSGDAASSRADISACFSVDAPEDEGDSEDPVPGACGSDGRVA